VAAGGETKAILPLQSDMKLRIFCSRSRKIKNKNAFFIPSPSPYLSYHLEEIEE
jgi:hypothetical protein